MPVSVVEVRAVPAVSEEVANVHGRAGRAEQGRQPREDDPEYERWSREIERELHSLGDDLVLVAHSVGAFIFLKFIVEHSLEINLAGIFLIAILGICSPI